ncbi:MULTISPECIES: dihydrofolate reductase [Sinorhizobium/Ensifer group]|jgi:dihydrofolate reductase|uniref:dihydrofolate reductase n=1 Tax=Sinorhizobium/Ensifer group TaxID=227292 RepID=UPI00070FCCE8|nr:MULTISPECIES: dihydrofolate reductase [Sinorhizobium/Ensifer group]KRD53079.1 diacylglycerol kinase [Ensifer sp. Root278]KSV94211.1 diacylglycerol kinase [Sinorhizobium sp. GL28]MBD9507211.1 dihydrofolate reductase [Ensifer sp. ENS10]MBV7517449.1 dihydrofolate reductase [Ensifer sp. ENS12]SDA79906.1 dihydrofolate reductase [Sinorhizobium sp. NFACC03]
MTETKSIHPKISIVVAVAANGVIGRDGDLPWRLSTDLKRFKALTIGKPVIMGRKTWASLNRPLPGRANIVITRNTDFVAEGADVVPSLDAAIAVANREAQAAGVDEICVIGGGEIYRQSIGMADILHVTEVQAEVDGDTRFPDIDAQVFEKVFEEDLPQGEKDSHAMHFVTWKRRATA